MKFEIGEEAISLGERHEFALDCIIVALPGHGRDFFHNSDYIIDVPSDKNPNDLSGFWSSREENLRKKPPEEASWEEIQKSIGWNPTKQGIEV
ncbi:MAG: hypothetical protein KAR06_03870 [Deltaproteobacteria bacterium]|nr:hypothetical protein [Deltaproteobacteria bacterium]